MSDKYERRIVQAGELGVEDRDGVDGLPTLRGYAALFNKETELFPGFRERIAPGAFARSLKENADVRALVDHDSSRILGRTKAGTLDLTENSKGLKVAIRPPETQVGQDVVTNIRAGNLDGMSIGFIVREESFKDSKDGLTVTRTLEDVDLVDVSVVTYPAYPDTSVAVRSLERWKETEVDTGKAQMAQMRAAIERPSRPRDLTAK